MEATDSQTAVPPSKFLSIPVAKAKPSPYQARKSLDEEALKGLVESIKSEGLLEPIIVRQVGDSYEVIAGERRLRAAKMLHWETIEAKLIETISEGETAAKGLIDNLLREDLNPIEEAQGYQDLLNLNDGHWTKTKIAEVFGKQQSHIGEALQLLTLPQAVQEHFRCRKLTSGHGVELARIDNANSQIGMANKIVKGGWSVMKTRQAIDGLKIEKAKAQAPAKADSDAGQGASGITLKRKNGDILIQAQFAGDSAIEKMLSDLRSRLETWLSDSASTK
jgi:ParB/RepB/Spo0J family partition protein